MRNFCIFAVIGNCKPLPCCAQLRREREAVSLWCYLGGLARAAPASTCSCFDFPLLLQPTPLPRFPAVLRTCRHCDIEVKATNGDGASAAPALRFGWQLSGWLAALMSSLCQSEPWSSLLLFLVICEDTSPLHGLQKALAARFLTYCWPFEVWWTGCWKEEFLKLLLWNSELIFAILCVVFLFITKNQIRMAVMFVWYAGGKCL